MTEEGQRRAVSTCKFLGLDSIVAIGGDGTFRGALALSKYGINVIGIPGTIDNDITCTDYTIGYDTAMNTVVDLIDKLRDTCNSHARCSVVEVMGRRCGDLAIYAGLACGAEMIITSATGYSEEAVIEQMKKSKASQKKHAIIVITEHITQVHDLAKKIEEETGFETRANVLGHMQRGGSPTAQDRVLATRMGIHAVNLLMEGKGGLCMSTVKGEIVGLPIAEVLSHKRKVDYDLYKEAVDLRIY